MSRALLRTAARIALAALMGAAGAMHFLRPELYMQIMPPYLPLHLELVLLSGVLEILGGAGLLVPRFRRAAGLGLMALLVAVFPANVHMALHPEIFGLSPVLLWLRLPLQGVLIAWAWWVSEFQAAP